MKSIKTVLCLVAQSCPTLCDPVDCSPPGFSAHGILQARILEWVAISFSRGSSWPIIAFLSVDLENQTYNRHVHARLLQLYPIPFDLMDYSPPGSSVHGDSPGKNTGAGCHAQPRDWTQVSPIARGFFTSWATREAPTLMMLILLQQNMNPYQVG